MTNLPSVLVVEDDPSLRKAICSKLTQEQIPCIEAATAEQAEKLLSEDIRVMTLDVYLPGKSGIEFLSEIRSSQQYANLPVVVVTCSSGAITKTKKVVEDSRTSFFEKNNVSLTDLVEHIKKQIQEPKNN